MTESRPAAAWPSLLALAGIYPAVVLVMAAVAAAAPDGSDDSGGRLLETPLGVNLAVFSIQAVLLGAALLLAALSRDAVAGRLGLVWPRVSPGTLLLLLPATLLPLVVGALVARALFGEPSEQLEAIERVLRDAEGAWAVYVALLFSLVPALCEEAFFRGFVQTGLQRAWRAPAAILVAALGFAVLHGDPMHVVGVAPTAIWLSFVFWATGSLWASAACHAFHNLAQVLAIYTIGDAEAGDLGFWAGVAILAILLLAAAAFAAAVPRLLRASRRAQAPMTW